MCRGKKAHIPASIRARTWMAYRAIQVQTADEEGSHPRRLTSRKAHIPASILARKRSANGREATRAAGHSRRQGLGGNDGGELWSASRRRPQAQLERSHTRAPGAPWPEEKERRRAAADTSICVDLYVDACMYMQLA